VRIRPIFWLAASVLPLAAQTGVETRYAEARKNPAELYAFLLKMPKGGDLHLHWTGAIYAETFLRIAAEDGLCLDLKTHSIIAPLTGSCGENPAAARAQSDNALRNAMIDAMSMRNFVAGAESGHDHFFNAFARFGPYQPRHRGELLAEIVGRAAEQNESYLEIMAMSGAQASAFALETKLSGDFDADRRTLLAAGLEKVVDTMRAGVDDLEQARVNALHCGPHPDTTPCRVTVRYLYQVSRESPKDLVFAQVLAGFMLASVSPYVAGVNFVQPEDGAISMRDYHLQMRMVDYAHGLFPKVHITLHAGELAAGLVPPDGLRFHIRDAVELGHAERIGHGVTVMYEDNAEQLLAEMRQKRVLVEINLTSNDLILGIRGNEHPLPVYRRRGVPVAISTDDEGVSRTHLTEEYTRAALTYGLSYADLKQMARNSLEFAFVEPKEKARLLLDLDRRFREFESSFAPKAQKH
jgi:adenosine deaminase